MGSLEDSLQQKVEYKEGKLFWKSCYNPNLLGQECGYVAPHGYRAFKVGSKMLLTHRVIWYLYYNSWPPEGKILDHINGDKLDNRVENLRLATQSQNGANRKDQINNTSGYRGVHFVTKDKVWRATIKINNKTKSLGRYQTAQEASEVYELAADLLFGEYKRGANYGNRQASCN